MCRYGFTYYRDHFACFRCRKAFKHWQYENLGWGFPRSERLRRPARAIACPDCSRPMTEMGLDFRAPRKGDRESWQIAEILAANGFTFHGCGCYVGYSPPQLLREVPAWLEQRRQPQEGERLAAQFAARARPG